MPSYNANPGVNSPVKLLQPGVAAYCFGSYDSKFPTTLLEISSVALLSNVATIIVTLREGKIPDANGFITIRGTSVAGGAFNVQNVAITSVAINAATGIGTITFPLTHADVVLSADTGMAYVPVPQVGEALVNGASQAFSMQAIEGSANGRTITWALKYPSAPAAVNVSLQAAMFDNDADYQTLDTSINAAGDLRYLTLADFNFLRMKVNSSGGGTSPTIVGVIEI